MGVLSRIGRLFGRSGAARPDAQPRPLADATNAIAGDAGFVYCLDSVGFIDGLLGITGWAVHETEALESFEIVAELPGGETVPLIIERGHARDDVARAVPNSPDGLESGFSAKARIADAQEVVVSIRMGTASSSRAFEAGRIANIPLACPDYERSGVLVLTERTEGACRRYRAEHLAEQLSAQGVDACVADITQLGERHRRYKHLVLQRVYLHALVDEVGGYFHKGGGNVLFELDDALFDLDMVLENDFLQHFPHQHAEDVEQIRRLMDASDGLITTTLPLAELMGSTFPDAPVFLNPNVASKEMLSLSQEAFDAAPAHADGLVRLGYFSGSSTHNRDFALLLRPLMHLMADDDRVRLCVVGDIELPAELTSAFPDRIERLERVDWRRLPALIASVDVNLMPLEDTSFNECKSAIKWMEAALVGVPTIASRNRELEREIEDGTTGILCSDEQAWERALRSFVEDAELRDRIARAAREEALAHHTTAQMNADLLALLGS